MAERRNKERRAKGTGSIKKIGKIYYFLATIAQKRIKQSLHTQNRLEAEKKAAELIPDLMVKTREDVVARVATIKRLKKQDKVRLSNVWEKFYNSKLRNQHTSEGTLRNYERNYNRFYNWLQENYPTLQTLSEITLEIANEYASVLDKDGLAGVTYNYHIVGMGTITKALMSEAGITENIWTQIPRKNKESIGKKALNQEEINRLFAVFSEENFCPMQKEQLEMLFYIGLNTGMRLIDCALLKWRSINMAKRIVSLIPIKTKGANKKITLPIKDDFKRKLESAATKWSANGYLLPAIAERYLRNISGVSEDILKVFQRAGFETTVPAEEGIARKRNVSQYGFHSLRHTFCSQCASNGININVLSEMTGDSVRTLEKYYVEIQHNVIQKAVVFLPEVTLSEKIVPANKTKEEAIAEIEAWPDLTEREKQILVILKKY